MEDKRIAKTKRNLKEAMIRMLSEEDFERISVTELCKEAKVSRITFYSHYSDKHALLDDIFNDMCSIGREDYYRRQKENNPNGELVRGYVNMLNVILDLYYARFDFFQYTNPEVNPYLASRVYGIILKAVEMHTAHVQHELKYSAKKIAGFVCFGMLGFVNECRRGNDSLEQTKKEAQCLLEEVLRSGILRE